VNGWDVRPTLERAVAYSSGRIVRNRLITAPGPDPAPPAAYLQASTVHPGHPVEVSAAACGGRLGGGPAYDGGHDLPRPRPGTDQRYAVTPHPVLPIDSARERRAEQDERPRLHRRRRARGGDWRSPDDQNWLSIPDRYHEAYRSEPAGRIREWPVKDMAINL